MCIAEESTASLIPLFLQAIIASFPRQSRVFSKMKRQICQIGGNILLFKNILHHLYYIHIFPKILQTARTINYVY